MIAPQPMVSCGGCVKRRRSVALWYLPRSGRPAFHAGLPAGWGFVEGMPFCAECVIAAKRRRVTKEKRRG